MDVIMLTILLVMLAVALIIWIILFFMFRHMFRSRDPAKQRAKYPGKFYTVDNFQPEDSIKIETLHPASTASSWLVGKTDFDPDRICNVWGLPARNCKRKDCTEARRKG